MDPVLHLSLPVDDLDESRRFYVEWLGCTPGRERPGWIDVWFHGMQVTLHHEPDQTVPVERAGVRHFGVTLPVDALEALVAALEDRPVIWVRPLRTEYAGTPREQRKAKVADPSGNVIELKAYVDPVAALEHPGLGPV